jgi:dipeptidyl aminopeptidase/acylaminoacyl peptidase
MIVCRGAARYTGTTPTELTMQRHSINRRAFLRRVGFGAGLSLLPAGAFAASEMPPLVARRVFFENPEYRNAQVSPDGRHLAYLAPLDGVRNLWVAPLDAPIDARPVSRATDRDVGWYRWAHTNRHLVYFRDHDGDENWRASSVDLGSGATVLLTPESGVKSFLQEVDSRFPDEVLLRHNARDQRYFDLFRVNLVSGKSDLVYENHEYDSFVTDGAFRLRLGIRFDKDGNGEVMERTADGKWLPFTTIPIGDIDATNLLGFSADGNTLFMLDPRGRDKAVLAAVDMKSKRSTILAADEEADIVSVSFADRRPIAALAERQRAHWHAIDPSAGKDLALAAAYGPGDIEFVSRSKTNRQVIVYYERDAASGEYALIDHDASGMKRLYIQHKALNEVPLRPLEPVSFAARDGLTLRGYLTRPGAESGGKVPLVLVIHGGPYARDWWGFNSIHQWLANRGYAALSINYRGSTGFGKAFVTAADHEWGGKMHDDLIDGLDWTIAQGFVDAERVGFFGGSYGGYSALMAATKTPDRFACIVDLFGPSNLITLMKTIPAYWLPSISIWHNRLGDPNTEEGRAFLADRSPLNHLERATKPILIAQGLQDVRVVAAESEQMVDALKKRDVPVTYITFADEGHGFVRPENRLAFNAVAEAFLGKYLGGRVQPVGGDFAGSSLQIPTGRDLIPGLPA